MDDLIREIIADLTTELKITDPSFDASLLEVKVKNAVREIAKVRNYPKSYTTDQIDEDLKKYYSNAREIARYDYNTIGADFQTSSNENSVSRSWISRNSLFSGVVPIAKF